MTDTRTLIDQLASNARPVRPLASPLRRTLLWALLAAVVIAVLVANLGLQPGVMSSAPRVVEWTGSLLTALMAAYAVFQISVPGRSPSWAWLPMPPLLLWLGALGWGCAGEFLQSGGQALAWESASWQCAQAITMISLPLGFIMLLMVRHAGVVRPAPTAALAALSAAAMSAAGVSLFHEGESALMVLVWHLGAVAVLSLLSWLLGRHLFAWIGHARR
ncbi:MAG TPA: NrsF family protein [Lysobacter sp.]|nr:NrsF family protein [Lysobacter sp.]